MTVAGPDCDDFDLNNWASCATCADLDEDDFYSDCDDYISIAGPDCDDLELTTYPGAPETCGDSRGQPVPGKVPALWNR